jgi:hypothetical protein
MISEERKRTLCKWHRRRTKYYWLADRYSHDDLGFRKCSCWMCDIHKQIPNKIRRHREKDYVKVIIEEELEQTD